MQRICTISGVAVVAALFLLSPLVVWGQGKAQPKAFLESAEKSLRLKPANILRSKSGVAMRALTSVQNIQDLRIFMATGNSNTVFKTTSHAEFEDAEFKVAGEKFQRVLRDPLLQSIQLVAFDLKSVETSLVSDFKMKLCEGAEPYCSTIRSKGWEKRSGRSEQMLVTLGGKGEDKPSGEAVFVRDGINIYGVLNVGTQTYVMRQLRDRVFAITTAKRDEIERSKDDVLELRDSKDQQNRPSENSRSVQPPAGTFPVGTLMSTCSNPAVTQVVEVAVMWTATASSNALEIGLAMRQLVDTAEIVANRSFVNSNIKGEIRVTHLGVTTYVESGDLAADIQELMKDGGNLEDLRAARRSAKADVGVLIVDHPSSTTCGMAAGISVPKEKAFAVVNWKCITDKLSFIHEIGHLAGAWHDPKTLGSGFVVDPPYAHGYVTGGKEPMATIMAYRESCHAPCGRRWYWSNPQIRTDDGQSLGTPDKNFDACVWRQRLPAMSKFDGA